MKLLFLENRQQTLFWEVVARGLRDDGHEIHWIVQGPNHAPSTGAVHTIPFPRRADERPVPRELEEVSRSDRGINYFGGTGRHYAYYSREIGRIVDSVNPDVAFGEPTLFHERLAIHACNERGIPYFFPGACRYPAGRFAFFEGDTLRVSGRSGDVLDDAAAQRLLDDIRSRRAIPDYMRPQRELSRPHQLVRRMRNDLGLVAAWGAGERFNTPSPLLKVKLNVETKRARSRWDEAAHRLGPTQQSTIVLFPLQMQPEANLDVWGWEWRDQLSLLRGLVEATDEDTAIIVKPNPSSKYELTEELLAYVAKTPRVHPVAHAVPMAPLFARANLVVTVTGTVAMECVFHGKPVVTFSREMAGFVPAARYLAQPDSIAAVLDEVRSGVWNGPNEWDALGYLQHLYGVSHPGWISNPYSAPKCLAPENIELVRAAFRSHLASLAIPLRRNVAS